MHLCIRFTPSGVVSTTVFYVCTCGMVTTLPILCRRSRNNSPLPEKDYFFQRDNNRVRVCKKLYLKLFDISDGRFTRALPAIKDDRSPRGYRSGKSAGSSRKLPQHLINCVINRIPSYQHIRAITHHNANRKYLRPDLNVVRLGMISTSRNAKKRTMSLQFKSATSEW